MQLKPEALNALKLPVKVKAGFLGSVKLKVCGHYQFFKLLEAYNLPFLIEVSYSQSWIVQSMIMCSIRVSVFILVILFSFCVFETFTFLSW